MFITDPLAQGKEDTSTQVRVVGSLAWAATLASRLRGRLTIVQHPELLPVRKSLPATCTDFVVFAMNGPEESGATDEASGGREMAEVLETLVWLRENRRRVRTVVVGPAAVRYRWCFLEAGAIAAFDFVWHAGKVAKLALRHESVIRGED